MNSSFSRIVIGPFSNFIFDLSIAAIGLISAAVPVKNASSAFFKADGVILPSATLYPRSFASLMIVLLVIPGRIEPGDGV